MLKAAQFGETESIQTLLKIGADIHTCDKVGRALGEAGSINFVKSYCLLQRGFTLLHLAAAYGQTETVEMLLKSGARIHQYTEVYTYRNQ